MAAARCDGKARVAVVSGRTATRAPGGIAGVSSRTMVITSGAVGVRLTDRMLAQPAEARQRASTIGVALPIRRLLFNIDP